VCILCTVFRLIVVLFSMMCVISVLCLIVVPLPLGENPFIVKYKYIYITSYLYVRTCTLFTSSRNEVHRNNI
jgi:hypothetical protein